MKKNKKTNKIVVLSIIGVLLVVCLIVFILNYTKDSSSLSLLEKNWINSHKSSVIDVSVYNDVPVYGQDGEGMIFSYLEEFTNSYGIEFNKVSYLSEGQANLKNVAFKIVNFSENLGDNDIELFRDYYVLIGKTGTDINNIKDLRDKAIGVLDEDISNVRYYLNDADNAKFTTGANSTELFDLLNINEIDYVILPQNLYLDDILDNDTQILFHFNELYKRYILTIDNDKTLKSIMTKYFMIYQKNFEVEKYKKYFLEAFFKNAKISDAERMNYNASNYVYGYVVNMPYENMVNKEFVGTLANYLSGFEDMADVDFKLVGYSDINTLKQAFSRGEVDVIFGDFNTSGVNVDVINTISPFEEKYVIISKDDYIINSIRSLKGKEISVVNGSYLYDYLSVNGINPKGYNNTDDLLRSIGNDSIVIMNKDTYEYYKDKKFKNYKVIYEDTINYNYTFAIRDVSKNSTFAKLFSFYISSIDYKSIRYNYNTDYIINSKNEIGVMVKYVAIIVGVTVTAVVVLYLIIKKGKKKENINKDDKLKFIDVMTSLKNRNYLNYNINKWEENVIYPQCIVIIDLNNIKYINDNYGHAEGDEVIKKAASILINNQIDNTDIVRTDGNEFLIYMVGYDEKKVQEYVRKINKEMKELPHEFGATLGYSMIMDDVKTIDDAINEATLSMRQAKEKL